MNVSDITAKARVLLEALPYIQDFRGSTFVVKYGGSFMDDPDPEVRNRVAYDIAFLAACGINVVVVHGGGKAITKAMEQSGLKSQFASNGMRITDEATVQIVKKTLDEIVNKDVCDAISLARAKPKGLAGDTVLVCEKLTVDDNGDAVDLGYVGEVVEVKVKLIKKEIAEGYVPVISPVAEGHDGKPYACDPHSDFGKAAQRALKRTFPGEPMLIREGGSIPIVQAFRDILGVDTLLLGLALSDAQIHSPNENFPIENFEAGIRLNQALLEELAADVS
jgi:acetylglutamate kinase